MSANSKTFIGSAFMGRFHKEDQTHIDLVIDGTALRTMIDLLKEAHEAKEAEEELPDGTYDHPRYGLQLKLEVKNSYGDPSKLYCALNTWKPTPGEKKTTPPPVAEVMSKLDPDDLPF